MDSSITDDDTPLDMSIVRMMLGVHVVSLDSPPFHQNVLILDSQQTLLNTPLSYSMRDSVHTMAQILPEYQHSPRLRHA